MSIAEEVRPEQADQPAPPPAPPLRKNRDFLLLWVGAGTAFLGSRVSLIAYPLLVLWLTGSAASAGLVGFAANLPYLLVQLPAGVLVDRWDRRRMMIVCDLGRILAIGTVVAAVWAGKVWIPQLMAVAFVESSLTIVYRLAERAAVRNVVPESQLSSALAQNEARERAAGLLGQPVGSTLFGLARWSPFLFTTLAHVVSFVSLLFIRSSFQAERAPAAPRRLRTELLEGLRWAWQQRFMRAAAGLIAGANFLFQALNLAMLVIVHQHGGSTTEVAAIGTASGLGGMAGALGASWLMKRISLRALVIGANAAWAVLMPTVAFTSSPYLLGALFAAMTGAGAIWNVAAAVYQLRITPDHMQGRAASVTTLVAFGTVPLGSLVGGYLLDTLGAPHTVLTLGGAMILLALAAAISPAIRHTALDAEPAS